MAITGLGNRAMLLLKAKAEQVGHISWNRKSGPAVKIQMKPSKWADVKKGSNGHAMRTDGKPMPQGFHQQGWKGSMPAPVAGKPPKVGKPAKPKPTKVSKPTKVQKPFKPVKPTRKPAAVITSPAPPLVGQT